MIETEREGAWLKPCRQIGHKLIGAAHESLQLEQLKATFDRLPDGIVTVDRRLDVVHANNAAKLLLRPSSLREGDLLPDVWNDFGLSAFVRRLFEPSASSTTVEVRPGSGPVHTLVGSPAGRAGTVLLVFKDVTRRERRAEAEHEFLANAAHELITPLTGIVGAAHVLESGGKVVPETRDRFIAHIARECDRLARIARALLVLARARSGEEPLRLKPVRLRPLLEDAVEGIPGERNVELNCPVSLMVFTDRDLAEQAIANLLANAGRHARGAKIVVNADRVDHRTVGIEVSDHGLGMAPDELERAQRRFVSGKGRDGVGFGLGLSIAAQSLEVVGGRLALESVRGQGTRALVELPADGPATS